MAVRKSELKETHVEVMEVAKGHITYRILGTNPIILNSMSAKARQTILLPPPPKNAAERASTLKHDPLAEFRASPYVLRDDPDVYLAHLASAFKGAIRNAAVHFPGAYKTQIGQLVYVEGDLIGIYGIPKIFSSVVRSADINHTPDIRTRVIVPEWAAEITVSYVEPIMKGQAVSNLLAGAGILMGIGDWRPEKGKGDYGQFQLVGLDDPDWNRIVATGGREAQIKAMEEPEAYDLETEELLTWYQQEVKRRGFKPAAKTNGAVPAVTKAIS